MKANLSKKQLIWSLIVSVCEARKDEIFFEVFDESEMEEISVRYQEVINNSSEKFSFVTKVLYIIITLPLQIQDGKLRFS